MSKLLKICTILALLVFQNVSSEEQKIIERYLKMEFLHTPGSGPGRLTSFCTLPL